MKQSSEYSQRIQSRRQSLRDKYKEWRPASHLLVPQVDSSSLQNIKKQRDDLCQEVTRLGDLLSKETANSLCQENTSAHLAEKLDETRQSLAKQKTLKEMYINRGKETRRELENLEKYMHPDTLSTAKVAYLVRGDLKWKKKKDLMRDFEELQVAYILSEEKLSADLKTEKLRSQLLQDKVQKFNGSHDEVRPSNETDDNVDQLAETLRRDLDAEIEQRKRLQQCYDELQEKHQQSTAEIHVERQKYDADISSMRQQAETLNQELKKMTEQKDILLKYYTDLQESQRLSQEKSAAELQTERDSNKLLHEELKKIRASYQDMSQKYESEVTTARQQTESIQRELDNQIKSHANTVSEGWHVINNLKAQQDTLLQKMTEEINILKQSASEKEVNFERELEELKNQLNTEIALNLELSTEFDDSPPRKRSRREEPQDYDQWVQQFTAPNTETHTDIKESCEHEPIPDSPPHKVQQEPESLDEKLPETPKSASVWKRTRHFLGLSKPEKWKK